MNDRFQRRTAVSLAAHLQQLSCCERAQRKSKTSAVGSKRTYSGAADKAALCSSLSGDWSHTEADLHFKLYILRDAYEAGIAHQFAGHKRRVGQNTTANGQIIAFADQVDDLVR